MTKSFWRVVAGLAMMAMLGIAEARTVDVFAHAAVMESLSSVHPRLRGRWLAERGITLRGANTPMQMPADSGGLRLAGKFGRGPAFEVTGRDSLIFLSMGSEVAIVSFAQPDSLRVLAEVQANGLVRQAALCDSFLYVSSMWGGAPGIDIWNVQDPQVPVQRGHIATLHQDFCVRETLLYATQALDGMPDTFKVYSVSDPEHPYLLGSCRDSGDAVTVTNGAAFLADRWGLYVVDVTDPRNPHRVCSYPGVPLSVEARGNICCVTFANPNQPEWLGFDVIDVTDPAAPRRLGGLDNTGGYDIFLEDTFAYLSGYYTGSHEFKILSIADSTRPRLVGACTTPGERWGVWASGARQKAYVADFPWGLTVISIASPSAPVYDTSLLRIGIAYDVAVENSLACVASDGLGMLLLDVSDPGRPVQLGVLDSTTTLVTRAVAVKDSFAYMGHSPSLGDLHTVDINDPARPTRAGGVNLFNRPEDMVLRDSFVYCAEVNRFQVVNVARPREPRLVGSCVTQDGVYFGLVVQDTLAYVVADGLQIISIARPSSPYIVSTTPGGAAGLAVRDTFAYIPNGWDSVRVYSVANPASPRWLSSAPCGVWPWDAALGESTLYVATSDGWGVDVYDVSNPGLPVRTGRASAPTDIRRLHYAGGLVYAAMWDAGVAIYEMESTGIAEGRQTRSSGFISPRVAPNPTARVARLTGVAASARVTLFDASGREIRVAVTGSQGGVTELQMRGLAAGVYFAEAVDGTRSVVLRIVKR